MTESRNEGNDGLLSPDGARYRYLEWVDGESGWIVARELYDEAADPDETVNVAGLDRRSATVRCHHISTDGGVTWGPARPGDIPITPVDGSMVRYSATRAGHGRDRILFSGPRGAGGLNRNTITLWTSYDEAQTFIIPVSFNQGFAAYSVI